MTDRESGVTFKGLSFLVQTKNGWKHRCRESWYHGLYIIHTLFVNTLIYYFRRVIVGSLDHGHHFMVIIERYFL